MNKNNNSQDNVEKRLCQRRAGNDRRVVIRFEDSLGRRNGVERRVLGQPD